MIPRFPSWALFFLVLLLVCPGDLSRHLFYCLFLRWLYFVPWLKLGSTFSPCSCSLRSPYFVRREYFPPSLHCFSRDVWVRNGWRRETYSPAWYNDQSAFPTNDSQDLNSCSFSTRDEWRFFSFSAKNGPHFGFCVHRAGNNYSPSAAFSHVLLTREHFGYSDSHFSVLRVHKAPAM